MIQTEIKHSINTGNVAAVNRKTVVSLFVGLTEL